MMNVISLDAGPRIYGARSTKDDATLNLDRYV